jgi:hypothetical protein
MNARTIFDYITTEESNYILPVNILDWEWGMKDHIKTSFFYKHGRLLTGNSDNKPVKNIVKPILNLQYRTEDVDVKDIQLYIDQPDKYHLSFLVKKYHDEVFIKEFNIDEFIDNWKVQRIDYGLGLIKNVGQPAPEIIPLESLVFCDQTDILSGPIGIKHYFSPDQLQEMGKRGWGEESNGATITIQEAIVLAQEYKKDDKGVQAKTPGKYIEVYEVHGVLPESFLNDGGDPDTYIRQMQIVCFYKDEKGDKQGITLFKKKLKENPFKITKRDPVHGRACGYGGVEELFEPQVWINYSQIRMKDMLDAASKTILQTTDPSFTNRNKVSDMDNLEIAVLQEGSILSQVDTFPRNLQLFEKAVMEWENHAQQTAAANDSIMGENPNSGTPFKLQELVTQESHGLHDYRKGQYAKDLEIVYRDWILPYIAKEITKGTKFLSSLDLDEMQSVVESVVTNEANKYIKELILTGQPVNPEEVEMMKAQVREMFMKDNKKFIEILKDEMKDLPLSININVSGKQKNLSMYVDKLVNIFRQILAAPQVLENPGMAKLFNQIIEGSGLSPVDFTGMKALAQPINGQEQPN